MDLLEQLQLTPRSPAKLISCEPSPMRKYILSPFCSLSRESEFSMATDTMPFSPFKILSTPQEKPSCDTDSSTALSCEEASHLVSALYEVSAAAQVDLAQLSFQREEDQLVDISELEDLGDDNGSDDGEFQMFDLPTCEPPTLSTLSCDTVKRSHCEKKAFSYEVVKPFDRSNANERVEILRRINAALNKDVKEEEVEREETEEEATTTPRVEPPTTRTPIVSAKEDKKKKLDATRMRKHSSDGSDSDCSVNTKQNMLANGKSKYESAPSGTAKSNAKVLFPLRNPTVKSLSSCRTGSTKELKFTQMGASKPVKPKSTSSASSSSSSVPLIKKAFCEPASGESRAKFSLRKRFLSMEDSDTDSEKEQHNTRNVVRKRQKL